MANALFLTRSNLQQFLKNQQQIRAFEELFAIVSQFAGTYGEGDILIGGPGGVIVGLPDVAVGNVLLSGGVGAAPVYGKVNLVTMVTGILPVTNGGLDLSSVSQGDLLYGSAANTYLKLAKSTTATRYLANTGASNNPAWDQVSLTNGVTGMLPFSNLEQGDALSVLGVAGNATATVDSIVAATNKQVLRRSGTSVGFGAIDISSADAVSGILAVENGGTGVDGSTQTYTPTRSAEVNLDSNVTVTTAQFLQVGETVTVSGRFTADPTTTATTTGFELSLPVASNIGAVEDVAGVAFCGAVAGQGAEINGSIANNTAVFRWVAGDTTSQSWSYTYTYRVI